MKPISKTTSRARKLRSEMPKAEKKLWYEINREKLGVKFRRQQPIGPYFVDFVCQELKLVIELDGDSHVISKDAVDYDNRRTEFIKSEGYKIIRIPNHYIYNNLESVVMHLQEIVNGWTDAHKYFGDKYEF